MKQVLVVARHEVSLLRSEIIPVLLYFIMPLAILAFVQGGFKMFLDVTEPGEGYSGADLAAPGQATMFGFMCLATMGYFFLGEFGWGTWNRLRSLGLGSARIMGGKLSVNYLEQLLLFSFVMLAGALLFDLNVNGSILALIVIELVTAFVIVGYGLIACALASNQAQFNAFSYLGALVMAGLGGALTPFATLPDWAQKAAPFVPTYWAVRAFEEVILKGGGLADVRLELAVLGLFAVVFFVVGALLFQPDKQRTTWA